MDKLTAIKIKYEDGTYSDQIPVSVLGKNVEWDATHTLVDILGSIDVDITGTIQDQITQLFNSKVNATDLSNYVNSTMKTEVASWLNNYISPATGTIAYDASLSIQGAAADAKAAGQIVQISTTKPTKENNRIWVGGSEEEYEVPTMDEFNQLKSALDGGFIGIDFAFTDGGYISASNGNLIEYAHWKYTDYIDISNRDSDVIYAFTTAPDNRYYNAYYDKNKTFISSFTVDNAEITIPDNTVFIRMSVQEAYSCGIKIYENGIKNDISNVKDSIFSDSYFIKSQLEFEAGGISISSGHDYDGSEQKNRLRSKFAYADRAYTLFQSETLPSGGVFMWYKVFYWNDSDFTKNASSQSNWFRFPVTPKYVIPKGSYFRVLIYSEQYPDPITNVKLSFVYQHFDIGVMINNEDLDDTGIITLNKEVLPFVQSLPTSYPENAKTYFSATHTPITFAHFSDIHNRPELWLRIAEYVDEYNAYLSFALHTGDYVGDNQTNYTDLYAYYMPSVPFYNCVGNHDTYVNGQHATATKQSVYEKLFNHISNWGVTFMSGDYSMTYYKDFADSNIRLIVFDNYYDISTQKEWLANILEDARTNGLHVITASHQVTGRPQAKVNCTFETLIPYESAGSGSLLNTEFDAVIGDFINNGGKHIVHLCGHEHTDSFYKTANGVLNYAIECATDYTGWTEGARVPYTKSWDCFNAISVDTELGILKIVRIGHNVDCFNRAKNILSYDYVNGTVLNNE